MRPTTSMYAKQGQRTVTLIRVIFPFPLEIIHLFPFLFPFSFFLLNLFFLFFSVYYIKRDK